jgi:branched-chain amino acid transport system substrate-binding protein
MNRSAERRKAAIAWRRLPADGGTTEVPDTDGATRRPTAGGAGKRLDDIERRYIARTKEPWLLQEPIMAYGHIMLLALAVERAGNADRRKVAEQIRAFDLCDGPALLFPGRHVQYDPAGGALMRS